MGLAGQERTKANEGLRTRRKQQKDVEQIVVAQRAVMSYSPDLRPQYWKAVNCTTNRPCNQSSGCRNCAFGVPFREHTSSPFRNVDLRDPEFLRGKSKNFRATAGRGVAGAFDGFGTNEMHAVTLGIHFGAKTMDCSRLNRSFRKRFKAYMMNHLPDAVVYLVSDIAGESTATFGRDWPSAEKDPELSDPTVRAGLYLHAHGFIGVHGVSRAKLRYILKEFFKGSRRVMIEDVESEYFDEHGRLKGGVEGFIEYAAMEKTDLDFPSDDLNYDNVAMFEAISIARKLWRRNGRKIKINHKGQHTDSDPCDSDSQLALAAPDLVMDQEDLRPVLTLSNMQVSHYKWSEVRSTAKALNLLDVPKIIEVSFSGRSMLIQIGVSLANMRFGSKDTLWQTHLILFSESVRFVESDCPQHPRWKRLIDTG